MSRVTPFFRAASLIIAIALLAGCARTPLAPPVKEPVVRIRVIPVAPVDRLETENKGVPLGVLWQSIADRVKSKEFNERMDAARKDMGPKMTAALLTALKARGFDAQVMEGFERSPSDPDDIDYRKLPGVDPVLHVYFDEVGMYSSRFSLDYVPRVNVKARLIRARSDDYLYRENIRYGADASGEASGSVPAAEQFKWPSFDALVQQPGKVAESFDVAVNALAQKIALNIRAGAQ